MSTDSGGQPAQEKPEAERPPAPPPYEPDISLITTLEKGLKPSSGDGDQR